ncbi:DUF3168 domain-containing protein [Mesorhizobium sp. ASY16-5R]|uniref:DUF3168 domain-containing protein n=1 Tax=Mesorhizobium sp. ASY16-5R TaxID=3445772 RepID=UPI003F9ED52E
MADSALPLLTAVQTLLLATAPVTALVGTRVYGAVPVKPTYPFILVTADSLPFAANDFAGMEHRLRVQAFARENRPGTVLTIRQKVFDALNRNEAALTLPGNTLVLIEHDGLSTCFPEEDGRTYQSAIEFKALVV